jgi:hypothetical protein
VALSITAGFLLELTYEATKNASARGALTMPSTFYMSSAFFAVAMEELKLPVFLGC